MPALAAPRLPVQGTELVETEHPTARRRVRVQVEDAVLRGLELGVGRGLPRLVMGEADPVFVQDPPQLAAADVRDDPVPQPVGAQLGQAPAGERSSSASSLPCSSHSSE
jgi:hypothetical protein